MERPIAMEVPTKVPPLARSVAPTALDWADVDPAPAEPAIDALGLSPADRAALGLSQARIHDVAVRPVGDAKDVLAEALAHGAAVHAPGTRRKKA